MSRENRGLRTVRSCLFAAIVSFAVPLGCASSNEGDLTMYPPPRYPAATATLRSSDTSTYKPQVADRWRHGGTERTKSGKLGR